MFAAETNCKIKVCESHLENFVNCRITDYEWTKFYWNCGTKEYVLSHCKIRGG